MNFTPNACLLKLANEWLRESRHLSALSSETYEKLRTGELKQEDAIIYSVYEYAECARTLQYCAEALKQAIHESRARGGK